MRPATIRYLLPALALLAGAQAATAQPMKLTAEEAMAARENLGVDIAPVDACLAVTLRTPSTSLFRDGFESGDSSAWGAAQIAEFSARQILDLELEVLLDGAVTGDHLLRLDLETPKGHLYQRLTVPFSASPATALTRSAPEQAARTRRVPGYPRPLPVQRLQVGSTKKPDAVPAVSVSFPVAGTPVVHSSLYGEWRARPYLDDSTTPCGDAITFALNP